MPTNTASLRGMPRVNSHNGTALLGSFVGQQISQSLKRPLVHGAALFGPALPRPRANLPQILNHNRCALRHALNETPTDNVVAIKPKTGQSAPHLFQVAFGRFRSFGLQLALQSKVSLFGIFPSPLTEKAVIGTHGGTANAKVYADYIFSCHDFRFGQLIFPRKRVDVK